MQVGFTGTRKGMIKPQVLSFCVVVKSFGELIEGWHHGDCVGSDEKSQELVKVILPKTEIVIHPPLNPKHRAWCRGDVTWAEKGYFERNIDIVNCTEVLVATPKGMSPEHKGSGTWHCIRYAQVRKKRILVIWPNGSITEPKSP